MIRDVHEEISVSDSSSDSDDDWSVRKSQKQIFKPDSPEEQNVQPTFAPKQHSVRGSTDWNSEQKNVTGNYYLSAFFYSIENIFDFVYTFICEIFNITDILRGRSVSPSEEVTEDDFQELLKRHRKRRMNAEETDDLDTRGITLEGIMSRCHTSRRNVRQQQNGNECFFFFKKQSPL